MSRILVEIEGKQVAAITKSTEEIIRLVSECFGIELLHLPLKVQVEVGKASPKIYAAFLVSPDMLNGNGLPKLEAVIAYIESRMGYSHDHRAVSQAFLGFTLKSNSKDKEERRKFNILSKRIKRARRAIEKKNPNGHWIRHKEGWGDPVLHTFVIK